MDTSVFQEMTTLAMSENLSVASRLLNTSPSVLSRHISQVEKQLGYRLFDRRQGSPVVVPTVQGEIFIESAQRMQLELKQLKYNLSRASAGTVRLRIGSSFDVSLADSEGFARARAAMPAFAATIVNPRMEVSLLMLKEGRVNLAYEPMSRYLDDVLNLRDMEVMPVLRDPAYLIVHVEDPLAKFPTLEIGQLEGFNFLQTYAKNESCVEAHLVELCDRHGFQACTEILPYENPLLMFRERLSPGHGGIIAQTALDRAKANYPNARFVPIADEDAAFAMSLFVPSDASEMVRQFAGALSGAVHSTMASGA